MPSPLSPVEICNNAIMHLGHDRTILSFEEETTTARALERSYNPSRQQALSDHPWRFALKRAYLAATADTHPRWSNAYALPADCLRPVELVPASGNDQLEFEVEGTVLFCDTAEAELRYVWDLEDSTRFDPGFVRALEYMIAAKTAMVITGSMDLQGSMYQLYSATMQIGQANAATAARLPPERPTSFRKSRS